jgi:hypothetical protein
MRNFGITGLTEVGVLGTNGKMSEISAAVGLTSFESFDEVIWTNHRNYAQYQTNMARIPGMELLRLTADLDLYQPTKDCLELLGSRLTKGSVVGFDELNHAAFPGETVAVHEALGLNNIQLRRSPWSADESYFVV